MNYKKILQKIAEKEHVSAKEAEREMAAALKAAGISCSVKKFLEDASNGIKQRLYIV